MTGRNQADPHDSHLGGILGGVLWGVLGGLGERLAVRPIRQRDGHSACQSMWKMTDPIMTTADMTKAMVGK